MHNQMIAGYKKYFLVLLFASVNLIALFGQDSLMVRGTIVAGKNKPLENVTISVKGLTARPVVTDVNGSFSVSVPSGDVWLIIKPLNTYKSKEVFLGNRQILVISMVEKERSSGYDELKLVNMNAIARDIISPSSVIDISSVKVRNIVTVDQMLQGNVPGMYVVNSSGMPGAGASMLLRGIRSMNSTTQPLIVVDGMPLENAGIFTSNISGNAYNPMSSINPKDISSINVLKGPGSTTLFGTKAANGIILINTLDASSTETEINIFSQNGFNLTPDRFMPQLSSIQYKTFANEVLGTSPFMEESYRQYFPGLYILENEDGYLNYMHDTNWQKYIFSNGVFSDIHFSIKGGSEIATYGLSVGYHDEGGVFKNTGYNRFSVRFVSDFNLFTWFNINFNASLSNSNSFLKESAISKQLSPVLAGLAKSPLLGPYNYSDAGEMLTTLKEVEELGISNPLAIIERYKGENNNNRFLASIKGRAELNDYLNWNTILGLNFNSLKENVFMPNRGVDLYLGGEVRNISQSLNNYLYSVYNDNTLKYTRQFNSIHDFDAFIGFRLNTNQFQSDFGEAQNLPLNDEYTSLGDGQAELRSIDGNNYKWNWLSFYQQISYKFRDKYLLQAGLSSDFSTRTGSKAETSFRVFNMPFETYYAIGAGWRMSSESFLSTYDGLENLFLRVSYGSSGNDDIGNYNSLDYYEMVRYAETSGLVPGTAPNEQLKPEKNFQLNAGLDLSLRGDRTAFTFDFYDIRTANMMIYEPQKSFTGYSYKAKNAGSVKNKGWEFSIYQRLIDSRKFKWDVSTVFSRFSNKVSKMEADTVLVTSFPGGEFATMAGYPVNSFYGYKFNGVFSTFEDANQADLQNARGIPFEAGDAIYEDISGPDGEPDGIINNYDKVILGSPHPDFTGSLSIDFYYGRWSLQTMFQFVYGNEIFNYIRYKNERMSDLSNQSQNVLKRWQYNGDQTDVPRASWNDPTGNAHFSSRWIEDGSYVRLKNITLGYHVPEEFFIFKNAEFYLSATNLLTFSKYLAYDPEFSFSFDPMRQGIDYGLMPQYRQVMLGVKVGL